MLHRMADLDACREAAEDEAPDSLFEQGQDFAETVEICGGRLNSTGQLAAEQSDDIVELVFVAAHDR